MKRLLETRTFYFFLSFVLALLLFLNANATIMKNANGTQTSTTPNYFTTIEDVQIDVKYDANKYYVSGFEPKANVYLTSYNKIRLDAEENEATRSFTLVADISNYTPGTYSVAVKAVGLNQAVTADIEPKSLSITIEKKAEKKFAIKPVYSDTQLVPGYSVQKIKTDPAEMLVTSGEETIKQIDHLEVVLPNNVMLDHDYTGVHPVKAVDAQGKEVACTLQKENVELSFSVAAPTKVVKVIPDETGTKPSDVLQYAFILSVNEVTISGPLDVLEQINEIHLAIKIDNITSTIKRLITFSQEDYSVSPITVEVTIVPSKKEDIVKETNELTDNKKSNKNVTGNSK